MKNIDQNQKINDDIINKSEINQNQEDQIQNDKSSNCLNKVTMRNWLLQKTSDTLLQP